MKVILISGKARHGKDTVASFMESYLEDLGNSVLIIHYADLLKYICKEYFGWDGNKDVKGRETLQYVGTEIFRAKDEDFWVDFVIRFLHVVEDRYDYVIIPDTRFINEVKKVSENFKSIYWRVERDPEFDDSMSESTRSHSSETSLDAYSPDVTIYNYGDLDELKRNTVSLLGFTIQKNIF